MLKALRQAEDFVRDEGQTPTHLNCLFESNRSGELRSLTEFFRPTDFCLSGNITTCADALCELSSPTIRLNLPRINLIHLFEEHDLEKSFFGFLEKYLASGNVPSKLSLPLGRETSRDALNQSLTEYFPENLFEREARKTRAAVISFLTEFSLLWTELNSSMARPSLEIIISKPANNPEGDLFEFLDQDLTACLQLFGTGPLVETDLRPLSAQGLVQSAHVSRLDPGDFIVFDSEIRVQELTTSIGEETLASHQISVFWRVDIFGSQSRMEISDLARRLASLEELLR